MNTENTTTRPRPGETDGDGPGGVSAKKRASYPTTNNSPDATPERLAYRINEVARMLGVSRRTIERELSAGRFPRPDARLGKSPLWGRKTLTRWIAGGGGR